MRLCGRAVSKAFTVPLASSLAAILTHSSRLVLEVLYANITLGVPHDTLNASIIYFLGTPLQKTPASSPEKGLTLSWCSRALATDE